MENEKMLTGIFDSHAHYDDAAFEQDRDAVLTGLPQKGVCGVICAASNLESAGQCIRLAERYDFVYAAAGIHGLDVETVRADSMERLAALLPHRRVVAVGEIGLDYHYDTPRDEQMRLIRAQLALAKDFDLPVILHDREAHAPMLELLREFRPRGVVHCFSGSVEMMREVVSLGLMIGLGGAVTFKNAVQPVRVAAEVPPDRLLLETDAPYMTPVPLRGKRNDSSLIAHTAERIAGIRGEEAQTVVDRARENTCRLFRIELPGPFACR